MHLAITNGVFLLSKFAPVHHHEHFQIMSSSAMPHTASLLASATAAACSLVKTKTAQLASSKLQPTSADSGDKSDNEEAAKKLRRRVTLDEEFDLFEDGLVVKPIGVVHSIYRLCVGTPRQGLLAPHARGRIELSVEPDSVLGLEEYSHVWVVFCFHLNTVSKNKLSKIAPPALGGEKVGVLTTRSPHRPNPIGMTLCQLNSVTKPTKHCRKTYLEVSGLDLVDGTPVLDIKPYVPHYDSVEGTPPKVPPWVQSGLSTSRHVVVTSKAKEELEHILDEKPRCLEFYGPHRGDESVHDTVENVLLCIEEVLAIDVRSAFQTSKVRKGNFQAERAARVKDVAGSSPKGEDGSLCTQQLDRLLIHYSVTEPENSKSASRGSGAEDVVTVEAINLLDDSRPGGDVEPAQENMQAERSTPSSILQADRGEVMTANEAEKRDNKEGDGNKKDTNHIDDVADSRRPDIHNESADANDAVNISDISTTAKDESETTVDTEVPSLLKNALPTDEENKNNEPGAPESSPTLTTTKKFRGSVVTRPSDDEEPAVLPPPGDAEFSKLKSYWSQAASQHTPTGLVPEKLESFRKLESERFYASDKTKKSQRRVVDNGQASVAKKEEQKSATNATGEDEPAKIEDGENNAE